jgi:hypothetical protein
VRAISCGSCGVFLGLQLARIGAGEGGVRRGGAAAAGAGGGGGQEEEEEEEEVCSSVHTSSSSVHRGGGGQEQAQEEQAQSEVDGSSDVSLSVGSDVFLSEPSQHSKWSDFDLDFGYCPSETTKRQRGYGECALRSHSLQVPHLNAAANTLS